MANEFIGRKSELETLQQEYDRDSSNLIPIYGRRRIGNSELVLHFLRDKPHVYFLAQKANADTNLKIYRRTIAQFHGDDLLLRVETWQEALEQTICRWKGKAKLILALDEFQWAAQSSLELLSVIQGLWDREWSKSGRIMVLLCGSQVGFMEKEVMGQASPLYGRRTKQLPMRPFNHLEAARFHPRLKPRDQAEIYFLTGGVAHYLRAFSEDSVETNIRNCFLDPHSALALEPDFLLREELREVAPYSTLLMALAGGATRHKDIAREMGGDTRNLNHYLRQLLSIRYICKRYPETGRPPLARHVTYAIDDPLLRFWFHFIFPNESQIRALSKEMAFQTLIKPGLDSFWGYCFEGFCRECLPLIYKQEGVSGWKAVGEYWDSRVQIDVVGIRTDHWTDLGECRWGHVSSFPALQRELNEKMEKFPNPLNHSIGRRVFLQETPKKMQSIPGVSLHTLEDLYRLEKVGLA
jgi:AAA+ ATPase superfamily predicted ATPase